MFKKMYVQKRKEMIKEYEKQEKRIKDLKSHGSSKKAAVIFLFDPNTIILFHVQFLMVSFGCNIQEKKQKEALTRKQEKGRTKVQKQDEDSAPTELLQKPREYIVKFSFPEPPPLQPPILGLHSKSVVLSDAF